MYRKELVSAFLLAGVLAAAACGDREGDAGAADGRAVTPADSPQVPGMVTGTTGAPGPGTVGAPGTPSGPNPDTIGRDTINRP